MTRKIKMLVLDMAGTTVNENNLVYKTLHLCLVNAGFECTLEQVLSNGAGKEKRTAIVDVLQCLSITLNEADTDVIFAQFRKDLALAYQNAVVLPQPGAEELFAALREKEIIAVLNTGYDAITANSLLLKLHWIPGVTFDSIVTASDVINGRPNPDMILFAMKQFNIIDPLLVAKVGDSMIDIAEGKNAGCGFVVGITTGAQTHSQLLLAHPDRVIDHLLELLPLI
jgi:phosphonatase-like hydrolase